jgi:hypothetical protein
MALLCSRYRDPNDWRRPASYLQINVTKQIKTLLTSKAGYIDPAPVFADLGAQLRVRIAGHRYPGWIHIPGQAAHQVTEIDNYRQPA